MVAPRFGKADPDIRKGSKETRDKPMLKAGQVVPTTGMVGGISNRKVVPSSAKSGQVDSFKNGGVVMGGFRNAAMEHKRG